MKLSDFSNPAQFYQHDIVVRSYEVDFNQNLRVTALFNYLQEIAWEHAENLDFGWDDLNGKGCFWALSRIEVEITRLPRWTDRVTLITWPRPADGIFARRDFALFDSEGNQLVAATSSWLVVNVSNRRPVRIAEWYSNREFSSLFALSSAASKIVDSGCSMPAVSESLCVQVGDIDMNQHVNNVRYIDWAYNTFSIDHYKNFSPTKVVVNFNAECKFGDGIEVQQFQISNSAHVVNVNRHGDSKNLCRLEFWWKPIE